MKKQLSASTGKIYRSWIISYSVILLLPLICNLVIYFHARQALSVDWQNTQYTVMTDLAEVMERELMRLNEFASKVASEDHVLDLLSAGSLDDYSKDYQSGLSLREMEKLLFLSLPQTSVISDYYLLSPSAALVWTGNGLYRLEDPLLPNAGYLRYLFTLTEQPLSGPLLIPADSSRLPQCSVLYPLPSSYRPQGYLAVTLDDEAINNVLRQVGEASRSRLYITDETGQVFYLSAEAASRPMEENLLAVREPIRGKTAWGYAQPSTALPLYYHVIAPFEPENASLSYLRFVSFLSLFFGVAGGILLLILIARRNYQPVQQLVETVSSQNEGLPAAGKNEYQLVSEALHGLYEQRQSVQEVISRQNRTLFAYYLSELMKGRISVEDVEEETLQNLENTLGLEAFCILLVLPDSLRDADAHKDLVQTAFSAAYDAHFLQILRRQLGIAFQVTSARLYDYEACVISVKQPENPSWQAEIREAADHAAREYAAAVSGLSYLACSGLYHGAASLAAACEDVSDLMPYAVLNSNETIFREDVLPQPDSVSSGGETDLTVIRNLVRAGHSESLRELLLSLVDRYASENFSFHTLKGICAGLVCHMFLAGAPWSEDDRIQLLHRLSRLDRETTLDRVKRELCETADLVCRLKSQPEAASRRDLLIQKIEHELDEHLYDENLNIMYLAQNLNMNPKYLSSVYQEATGQNLMDLIHRRRIERFKQLISEEQLSVREAAEKVGYVSVVTLNRWFRKFEGTTPGKWKEL